MRHATIVPVVCAVGLACTPRAPPPPPPPEILPLDTDAMAIAGIEVAQDSAERMVALAGMVGAFIGSESELYDAMSEGGLDRVVERAALASAACDAVITRDAAGAVHASWPEPCVLTTGTVVSGDLTVIESSDGNALTVLLAATGDGVTLSGFVGLTPQFWPVAWLLTDFLDEGGLAVVAIFDAEVSVAADDAGLFVIDLPTVTIVQVPYYARIGRVAGRVCTVDAQVITLDGIQRHAGACAIAAHALSVSSRLVCAQFEGEVHSVTGEVEVGISPHEAGRVDATLSVLVDGRTEPSTVSLELRPLGCR